MAIAKPVAKKKKTVKTATAKKSVAKKQTAGKMPTKKSQAKPRTTVSRNEKDKMVYITYITERGHTDGYVYGTQELAFRSAAESYESEMERLTMVHRATADMTRTVSIDVAKVCRFDYEEIDGLFNSAYSDIDHGTARYIENVLIERGIISDDVEDLDSAFMYLDVFNSAGKLDRHRFSYDDLVRHKLVPMALRMMSQPNVNGVRAYVPYDVPELKDIGFTIVKYGKSIPRKK